MPISLGPLPRPSTDAELSSRLSGALTTALGPLAQGLEQLRLTAALSGTDVTTLDVDLTGVTVPHLAPHTRGVNSLLPGVTATEDGSETPGVLHHLRAAASPLDVMGAPITLLADFSELPIRWIDARGTSFLDLAELAPGTSVTGTAHLEAPVSGLEVAATQVLSEAVGDMATIRSVDLTVTSTRPNTLSVEVAAQAKKSLFSAVVMATATVTVDRAMVATLSDLTLHSPNPVFSAALRLMSTRVAALDGRRFPLNTFFPGLHATDLQVRAGETVTVDATFG